MMKHLNANRLRVYNCIHYIIPPVYQVSGQFVLKSISTHLGEFVLKTLFNSYSFGQFVLIFGKFVLILK